MLKIKIFVLFISLAAYEAAVIKICDKNCNVGTNTPNTFGIPRCPKEPISTTSYDQDTSDMSSEKLAEVNRNEEATILIVEQELLDSEPAKLLKTDVNIAENKKSEKLLLLSTSKIAEKSKQPEEDLNESEEEVDLAVNVTETTEETTTIVNEYTTILSFSNELSTSAALDVENVTNLSTTEKTTKLFPINDTLYADTTNNIELNSTKIVVDDTSSAAKSTKQHRDAINANYGSIRLEEAEADYVLAETDFVQGSYTDVDSELHLQPIVQSVEIVPANLDDFVFFNYFQR